MAFRRRLRRVRMAAGRGLWGCGKFVRGYASCNHGELLRLDDGGQRHAWEAN